MFRGREITHPDIGWRLLQRMADSLKDVAQVDTKPVMVGRRMQMLLSPLATPKAVKKATEEAKVTEEIKET